MVDLLSEIMFPSQLYAARLLSLVIGDFYVAFSHNNIWAKRMIIMLNESAEAISPVKVSPVKNVLLRVMDTKQKIRQISANSIYTSQLGCFTVTTIRSSDGVYPTIPTYLI